jgi:hypothetical protein
VRRRPGRDDQLSYRDNRLIAMVTPAGCR